MGSTIKILNDEIYKFGITVNPERRFSEQLRNSCYDMKKFKLYYSDDGNIPPYLENILKQKYSTCVVDKEHFRSGYTETFSYLILGDIIKDVNLFLQENKNLIEVVIKK